MKNTQVVKHSGFFATHRIWWSILLLSIVLRFYALGEVPVGPNWDEAALGYNAYSILRTGKDEYGTFLPITLRSYDDYKPPLYMYLSVPFVAVFGLSLWSVRLVAAVSGVLAVIGTYFLLRKVVESHTRDYGLDIPLLGMFTLAISPWHLQFSRMAFEAGIGVTLNIWSVYFFYKGLTQRTYLVVSATLAGLAMYAYHSERVFLPLLFLALAFTSMKYLRKQWNSVLVAIIVGGIVCLPFVFELLNPGTYTRLKGTNSLADTTGLLAESVEKLARARENGDLIGIVVHNRRIVYAKTIVDGYLRHFSLNWLFIQGDNARHHSPGMGLLYLAELPFFLLGVIHILSRKGTLRALFVPWILASPVAASLTTELPHAIRTLVFLPMVTTAVAVGMSRSYSLVKQYGIWVARLLLVSIACLYSINGIYYAASYYIWQNQEYSQYWQYGYKKAVAYATDHYDEYDKIVVSTKLEQPHMFFLFFMQYDPVRYLAEGGTVSGGFAEKRNTFDKFEFRPINWLEEVKDGRILYIGAPGEVPDSLGVISYLNGMPAIHLAR